MNPTRWQSLASSFCLALCLTIRVDAADEKSSSPSKPAKGSAGTLAVEVQIAKPIDTWETKTYYSGIVKPKRKSELSFERTGRVDVVEVDEGDRVEAGQVIARLNSDQLEAQIRKLEAEKRAAIAVLNELKAGPRAETIDAARANVREQVAQLELAQSSSQRRQRLFAERLVPREELEQAAATVQRLEATRQAAQKRLEDLELGTRIEKIGSQEAAVESLEASIAAARVDLEHSVIRSPFAGSIVSRRIDEGYVASPGSAVFTVSEDSVLRGHFGVPPAVAQSLQIGESLKVLVRDQPVEAKLKSIVAQVGETTRSQEIVVSLAESAGIQLVAGDIARLELVRRQAVRGYWLDSAAVVQGTRGLWECFVIEPEGQSGLGIATRRSVEILHTEADRILVRGAIREGDRIVTSAVHRLSAGQRVRPVVGGTP